MTEPDENDFDISKNLNAKILMNTYDTNLTNAINLLDSYTNYVDENKDLKKHTEDVELDIKDPSES